MTFGFRGKRFRKFMGSALGQASTHLSAHAADKLAVIFLENRATYVKIVFFIFASFFHVESPPFRLYRQTS